MAPTATTKGGQWAATPFEIDRRRNFAIISHPDAGKTTLTEKLLLYGGAIQEVCSCRRVASTANRSGLNSRRLEKPEKYRFIVARDMIRRSSARVLSIFRSFLYDHMISAFVVVQPRATSTLDLIQTKELHHDRDHDVLLVVSYFFLWFRLLRSAKRFQDTWHACATENADPHAPDG